MVTAIERPTIRAGSRRIAYTPEEVAAMTGLHVATVRLHIKEGKLKAYRLGRKWQIPVGAIERLIASAIEE